MKGAWKGGDASYSAIHKWVAANFPNQKKCENCGKDNGRMNWANRDHKYSRDKGDWMMLCPSCHHWFDRGLLIIDRWEAFTGKKAVKLG